MTTRSEEERLAVVETEIRVIKSDVAEIKADVKALVLSQASRDAADLAHARGRASNGVWVRSLVPWVLAGAGLLMTLLNTFDIVVTGR